ncbi:MAG: PEGA domain-containing protein [Byssovorax sp.]
MRLNPRSPFVRPGIVAILACSAALLSAPGAALAQGKKPAAAAAKAPAIRPLSETLTGQAKAEYEAGKILYQDGDHKNALVKFQHAYELSTDARLQWNIAACEKNLRHYTRVLAALEKYQKEGGAVLTEQDKQDAVDLTATVRTLVSSLQVTVNEPGAEVFVDDEKIGTTPLPGPVMIDVGNRKIRVSKPGFKEFVVVEAIAGAGDVKVKADLAKEIHQGHLVVEAGAKDAIFVDGRAMGIGKWEGVLPSGGHSLRVTAPGMVAYQSEVNIQDDKLRRLPITLEEQKGGGIPTKWLLISGGGILVIGGVVAAVILTRPSGDPVSGTIEPGFIPVRFGSGGFKFGGGN